MTSIRNIRKFALWLPLFCTLMYYVPPLHTTKQNIERQGTFIIALICNDGIVMAADSRSVFFNDKKEIIAFHEGSQKIFQYNNIGIAMAGQYAFDTTQFHQIFNSFKETHNKEVAIKFFYNTFINLAKDRLNPQKYLELLKNQFLVCGYENKRTAIYWYDGTGKDTLKLFSGYKTNFKKDDSIPSIIKFLKNNNSVSTISIAEKIIQNIVVERNKNDISTIGGEASILIIKSKGIKWIKKQNIYKYGSAYEYYNSFINGNIKMWYRSKNDSISLRRGFDLFYR